MEPFSALPTFWPTAETVSATPMSRIRLWKETGLVFSLASSASLEETSSSSLVSALVHLLNLGAS